MCVPCFEEPLDWCDPQRRTVKQRSSGCFSMSLLGHTFATHCAEHWRCRGAALTEFSPLKDATSLHSSTEHCNRGASSCFGGTVEGVTVYFFTSKPLPGLASMAVEDPAARLWQFRSGNRPQSALHGPGRFSTKERTQEWPFLKVVREHPVLCSV